MTLKTGVNFKFDTDTSNRLPPKSKRSPIKVFNVNIYTVQF